MVSVLIGVLAAPAAGCGSQRADIGQVPESPDSSEPTDLPSFSGLEAAVRSTVWDGVPAAVLVVENSSGRIVDSVVIGDPARAPLGGGSRSAGSVMKVLILAAAIEWGTRPDDVLEVPRCIVLPERMTCGNAAGEYTVAEAITSSINPAFVILFERAPPGTVVEHGAQFGMLLEHTPTVLLGVHPVSMESIAALMVAIANDGETREITTQDGSTVVAASGRYVSETTAGTVRSLLRLVVTQGTGVAADGADMPFGKTGTAIGQTDAWFAGSTGTHTIVVWVGSVSVDELSADDPPTFVPNISGGGWPAQIFRLVADGIEPVVPP